MSQTKTLEVLDASRAEFLKTAPDAGLHLQHVAAVFSPQDLLRVYETDVNLVVLPRALTPELSESVERFGDLLKTNAESPAGLAVDLSKFDFGSGKLSEALCEVFASAMQVAPESVSDSILNGFVRDAAQLVESFAPIARGVNDALGDSGTGRKLALRIDRVEDDMCAAFHTDCYRMRLICTYRGAGTQWTANDNVNRREFYSLPAAERLIDLRRVFQMRAGWVAILKGEGFPGAEGAAIVHRSPPAVPGEWRLILRIDVS